MKNLLPSKKQSALLEYIDGFIGEHHYAPSYREVARALDYKSVSTVATHINGLIERGWLVKRDNSARSVEVVYRSTLKTAGQTTPESDPAPSLSESHESWLQTLIAQKLAASDQREADGRVIAEALRILDVAITLPTTEAPEDQ